MSTPSTPRSPYRHRRINVMLQESQSEGLSASEPDRPLRRPARNGRSVKLSFPRLSRNALVAIAAVIAFLSAAVMFVLLSRNSGSEAFSKVPSQPVRVEPPATASAPKPEAPPAAAKDQAAVIPTQPATAAVPPEQIHFKLRRASRPQAIGALVLRLVNSNPKRGTCTLAIAAPDGRSMQKALQTNRPFDVTLEDGQSVQVLVSEIGKTAVSGTLTQPDN